MTHWPKLMDALRERLYARQCGLIGCTFNVHPDDFMEFVRSEWAPRSTYKISGHFEFQDVRLVDNPLMLEGIAILVKDDTIQAVVNLEDGRSMETL